VTERKPRRTLAIGPINQCGQAYFWAGAVRSHLEIDAFSFAPAGPVARRFPGANFQGPAERSIPHHRLSPSWYRQHRLRRVLRPATHVLSESFLPLPGEHALGYVAHGSELRDPDAHMARNEYSFFRVASDEWVERLRVLSARNRGLAASHPTFVTTPDLLLDAPEARWAPLAIDVDSWRPARPAFSGRRPVVLHLPSRRDPPIKGTQYVDETMRALAATGAIEYLSPVSVPHDEMRDLVGRSDIVVDQILTGSYGVAAVEAMSAGRLVIGNVSDDVRALMSEAPPIVDVTPTTFASVMEAVLDDRNGHRRLADQGVGYCERWHNGRASAEALAAFVSSNSDTQV